MQCNFPSPFCLWYTRVSCSGLPGAVVFVVVVVVVAAALQVTGPLPATL